MRLEKEGESEEGTKLFARNYCSLVTMRYEHPHQPPDVMSRNRGHKVGILASW